MKSFIAAASLMSVAAAQSEAPAWGQCGGQGWSGPTSCVSGYTCTVSNDWYSQCVPGSSGGDPTTTASPGPTDGPEPGQFLWYGTNVAGAEFGESVLPGKYGKHFTFPDPAAVTTLLNEGYNTFRINYRMERLAPDGMTGDFDPDYLQNLTESVEHVTSAGANVILDPHNYGRYHGDIITDLSAFETYHEHVAEAFLDNDKVIFDTNNEYHTMDQTLVLNLNQAAIDGIRAAGADQYIVVEGNEWSGAHSWVDVNDNMKNLVDPLDKIVYQMHQYLDSDSSGTSEDCVSTSIGRERVVSATNWLRQNNKVAMLGEFAGGANPTCLAAVEGMLDYLEENSDVWWGFTWWAAGPWWGDYMYSFEPPSGEGYVYYNDLLSSYIA